VFWNGLVTPVITTVLLLLGLSPCLELRDAYCYLENWRGGHAYLAITFSRSSYILGITIGLEKSGLSQPSFSPRSVTFLSELLAMHVSQRV